MKLQITYEELAAFILHNQDNYYRLAFSYVRNREDALDIVQDSIVRAFSSRRALKETSYVKSWFYRIVINTSLDFIRKNKKYAYLEEAEWEHLDYHTEDSYEDLDLHNALERLSPESRIIIILRYFEDLKLQEIAQILGKNENTVKTKLYAALKKLKMELKAEEA